MTKFIGNSITLPKLSAAPSSPASGDTYYNTVDNTAYIYNGTSWVDLAATGGGSGHITDVIAGSGLTGGATSGSATLNVGAGTGITVNADDVAINTTVVPVKTDNLGVFAASTSAAIGVGSIQLGHASDTTLTRSAAGTLAVEGVDVVTTASTLDASKLSGVIPTAVTGKSRVFYQATQPSSANAGDIWYDSDDEALGDVVLTDSVSSTSTTTAATPNSVKTAYDLANAAVPKSTFTASGDILYASASGTPARLAKGINGQFLSLVSGIPAWAAVSADIQEFTSSGTWVKPYGKTAIYIFAIGGGGGGGGGSRDTTTTGTSGRRLGGGGGGVPGMIVQMWLPASLFAGTVSVTIGSGGSGGAGATGTVAANGTAGNAGGDTTFGTSITALGGLGGVAGLSTRGTGSSRSVGPGGIGGVTFANSDANARATAALTSGGTVNTTYSADNFHLGASVLDMSQSTTEWYMFAQKDNPYGAVAGGSGGGKGAETSPFSLPADSPLKGGEAGRGFNLKFDSVASGGTAGGTTGGAGTAAGTTGYGNGGGGGGGGTVTGGAGGAGYRGGGGGGGGVSGATSGSGTGGNGGAGGNGYLLVISI